MYDSPAYIQRLTANPVSVTSFQPLFLRIEALDNTPQFKFVVHQCYAVPAATDQVNFKFL